MKLYSSIKTDLVDPKLDAKVAIEPQAEPQLIDIPDNLYSAIVTNTPEINAEVEVLSPEARQFAYSVPHRLYSLLIPEKPSILAEERIFVYVPKATRDSAGIAKFATDQFSVIGGEVAIRSSYLTTILSSNLIKPEVILVVNELPILGLINRIYLVPIDATTCNAYLWNSDTQAWDFLGSMALTMNDYYTKLQIDNLLNNINLSLADYYTRAQVDVLLSNHSPDLNNYYTKQQVDNLVNDVTPIVLYNTMVEANTVIVPDGTIAFIKK